MESEGSVVASTSAPISDMGAKSRDKSVAECVCVVSRRAHRAMIQCSRWLGSALSDCCRIRLPDEGRPPKGKRTRAPREPRQKSAFPLDEVRPEPATRSAPPTSPANSAAAVERDAELGDCSVATRHPPLTAQPATEAAPVTGRPAAGTPRRGVLAVPADAKRPEARMGEWIVL